MELNKIYNKDSRFMNDIEKESIHLIITSPEYFGASMWNHKYTFDEYLLSLDKVWKECFRVLKPGGKLVINIADLSTRTSDYGRRKIYPTHSKIIENCEKIGFDYFDYVIWHKPNRQIRKVYGSYPYPDNFQFFIMTEYILVFRKWVDKKYFNKRIKRNPEIKDESLIGKENWYKWAPNVWNISPVIKFNNEGKNLYGHIAPFPPEIPNRLIRMYSFVNDIILDPFMGSGTVAIEALKLGRKYIGYEISEEYFNLCNDNINQNKNDK